MYSTPDNADDTATKNGQVSGFGAMVPLCYGRSRYEPEIPTAVVHNGSLLQLCVWSYGEIDAVESITINDLELPSGVSVRHYLGTSSQGVDPDLQAAIPGYYDTLRESLGGQDIPIAYSVVETPAGAVTGYPRVKGIIRGRKVFDPRSGQTVFSANPSLCLADLISSPIYGQGRQVLGADVCADANDEQVGGEPRRAFGLVIKERKATSDWVETIREYAGCFAFMDGAAVRLVPDRPSASVGTIIANDMIDGSFKRSLPSARKVPNVVSVSYTDTSKVPWRDTGRAYAYADGVANGQKTWRDKDIDRKGYPSGAMALRAAIEALLKPVESGLKLAFKAREDFIKYQEGDVIDIDHARYTGLMRITEITSSGIARYSVSGYRYSDTSYSDESVFTELLPPPAVPRADTPETPSVSGVVSGNATYQITADGTVQNRVKVDITASSDPNICSYKVTFRKANSSDPWQPASVEGLAAWLEPVVETITYDYQVSAVSCLGGTSNPYTGSHTVTKKDAKPGLVDSVTADTDQASGVRTITITDSNPEDDLQGYELEYSAGGSGYQPIIDGLTLRKKIETSRIPEGVAVIRARKVDRSNNEGLWSYTNSTYFPPAEPDGLGDLRDDVQIAQGDIGNIEIELGDAFKPPTAKAGGPDNATGLTFDGPVARVEWSLDPGAKAYKVEVWGNSSKRRTIETSDTYINYTADEAEADGGPWRTIQFRLWTIDFDGNQSSGYKTVNMTNTPPSAPSVSVAATSTKMMVTVNSLPNANDLRDFIVVASQSSGFNPESSAVAVRQAFPVNSLKPVISLPVVPGSQWYVKCACSDAWGKTGLNWTGETSKTAQLITETQIGDQSISTPKLKANAVTAEKISVGTLSAITANIGTVNAGLLRNVPFTNYINLGATQSNDTFLRAGTSSTINFKLDGAGNLYARGDIEARSLKANTVMVKMVHIEGAAVTNMSRTQPTSSIPVGFGGNWSWGNWVHVGQLIHSNKGGLKMFFGQIRSESYTTDGGAVDWQLALVVGGYAPSNAPSGSLGIGGSGIKLFMGSIAVESGVQQYNLYARARSAGLPGTAYAGTRDLLMLETMR